jgi:hypothetical protein
MKEMLTQILLDISIALLSLAASYTILLINRWKKKLELEAEKIKDERQRSLVQDALNQLNMLVSKTVTSIEQTTAGSLRQAVKQGLGDKQALLELSGQAYAEIVGKLKPEYRQILQQELGNLEKLITDSIEEKVFELKSIGFCSYQ